MERISIFNYEAFYLDFLEGNLNEADALLLNNFLKMNPDLDLGIDEALPQFISEEEIKLDDASKLLLKGDFEGTEIVESNISYFLVAEQEGLLSLEKQNELSAFLVLNPIWSREQDLAKLVVFHTDKAVIYGDKAGLKRKRRLVVLWPYASAVAAASILLFFYWMSSNPNGSSLTEAPNKGKTAVISPEKGIIDLDEKEIEENTQVSLKEANDEVISNQPNVQFNENATILQRKKQVAVDNMKSKDSGPIAYINEQQIAPITKLVENYSAVDKNVEVGDLALSNASKLSNPIEPITKFVSDKTKVPIEFKTAPKAENKKREFFIKIGKFEVSRNR